MIEATAAPATAISDATATTAPCPKCATTMVLAAITPHPMATRMERRTFLCGKCNQTKTYVLPALDGAEIMLAPARYFFIVQLSDMEVDDPRGTILPNDADAVAHAERLIRTIKEDEGIAEPSMLMIVRREAYGTVATMPFFPGRA